MRAVQIYPIKPLPPQLGGSNFDTERVIAPLPEEIKEVGLRWELSLLKRLPYLLREGEEIYLLIIKEEKNYLIAEALTEKPKRILGCAIDLGSTTIAFYFYDFLSDKVIKELSIYNPQIEIGEDILTRLHFAKKPENLNYLKEITVGAINRVLEEIGAQDIYFISLCGNTAMTHFLLSLPINYLIVEPYVPVLRWIPLFTARDLGLKAHASARVFIFPLAGTYFGGDLIAGLYEMELHQREEISIYLDVGTNAEVVIGNKDFLLACAGAAGPALEGGIFACGVQAKPGAIEKFFIDPKKERILYQTIGNKRPIGFCGSAVIQLMAELFLYEYITPEGKINLEKASPLLLNLDGERAIQLVSPQDSDTGKPIYLKEGEIKSFLRSKGAMFTILQLLTEKVGITFKEVYKFYVAGSFGNHIDVSSAVILGMLPEEALDKSEGVGNGAGKGALKFLKEANYQEVERISQGITYIELNVEGRFMELLTGALYIPHVNLELFPLVKKMKEEKKNVSSSDCRKT